MDQNLVISAQKLSALCRELPAELIHFDIPYNFAFCFHQGLQEGFS